MLGYPKVIKLYQATVDGFSKEKFYDKSINKGATMIIVKTTTGRIFGGFTKTSWDKSGSYKHDNSSFIFSVDYQSKHPIIKDFDRAIECD